MRPSVPPMPRDGGPVRPVAMTQSSDPLALVDDERVRARQWLRRLAEAAARHDLILGHFSGDPELGLNQRGQQRLVEEALEGLAPAQALVLLADMADDDLKALVANGLIGQLRTAFPPGHPLRDESDNLRAQRLLGGQVIEPTKPGAAVWPRNDQPAAG